MPLELITFLATFGLRAIASYMHQRLEYNKILLEGRIKLAEKEEEGRLERMKNILSSPVMTATASAIALITIIFVVAWPLAVPVFFPEIGLFVGIHETSATSVIWGLFSGNSSGMEFVTLPGVVIMPFHTHLVSAIAGFYFGGISFKHKR